MNRRHFSKAALAACVVTASGYGSAQPAAYPTRTVKIIATRSTPPPGATGAMIFTVRTNVFLGAVLPRFRVASTQTIAVKPLPQGDAVAISDIVCAMWS